MNITVRRALLAIAILLMLSLAFLGMQGGTQEWFQSQSIGQRIQTAAQFAYGLFALLTVASVWRPGTFARVVRVTFLVAVSVAAGLAPVVWGDAAWWAGLVAALAALVIGLLIVWLLSVGARGLKSA